MIRAQAGALFLLLLSATLSTRHQSIAFQHPPSAFVRRGFERVALYADDKSGTAGPAPPSSDPEEVKKTIRGFKTPLSTPPPPPPFSSRSYKDLFFVGEKPTKLKWSDFTENSLRKECKSRGINTEDTPSKEELIKRLEKDDAQAAARAFGTWLQSVVEIERGVPRETIQGAAVAAAAVGALATKGVVTTGVVTASAVYASIVKGSVGDVVRILGSISWDVAQAASEIAKLMPAPRITSPTQSELDAEALQAEVAMIEELVAAEQKRILQRQQMAEQNRRTLMAVRFKYEAAQRVRRAEEERVIEQERILEETRLAERARLSDKLAQVQQEEERLAQEAAAVEKAKQVEQERLRTFEEELASERARLLDEAARLKKVANQLKDQATLAESTRAQEAALRAERERQTQEALLAQEQEFQAKARAAEEALAAEQERLAQEAKAKEQALLAQQEELLEQARRDEANRIVQEMRAADQARAVQAQKVDEARQAEEARLLEELDRERQERARAEEQLQAAVAAEQARLQDEVGLKERLSSLEEVQAGLDGEMTALKDQDKRAASEQARLEEAARWVAEAQEQEAELERAQDDDGMSDEDWQASIQAAQRSLDEKIAGLEDALDVQEKAEWEAAEQFAGSLNGESLTDEDMDNMNMDDLAAAAREAVEEFEEGDEKLYYYEEEEEEVTPETVSYSDFTVMELRAMCKERGLRVQGTKVALASRLEEFDNSYEDDDVEYVEEEVEYVEGEVEEEVEYVEGEVEEEVEYVEEEFEVEYEYEDVEEDINGASASGGISATPDWSQLTVVQLRKECKSRGVSTQGRKVALIARIEEFDLTQNAPEQLAINGVEPNGEYVNGVGDKEDDDNLDLATFGEDVAAQARAAVAMYEDDEDFDGDFDEEELAAQARAAVEMFNNVDSENEEALGAQARAAMDIVKNMKIDDDDEEILFDTNLDQIGNAARAAPDVDASEDDEDWYEDEFDETTLAEAARAAVQMYDSSALDVGDSGAEMAATDVAAPVRFDLDEEPSDEALREIEGDSIFWEIEESVPDPKSAPKPDYKTMTVAELKAELKNHGLALSGKKADLIARLEQN